MPLVNLGDEEVHRTLTHDAWHYHPLHFQRTNESDLPHSPRVERACLSGEAARRYSEPALHPNPSANLPWSARCCLLSLQQACLHQTFDRTVTHATYPSRFAQADSVRI